ncbi:hypothetical protein VNI00_018523 [Paramarasmius palmivorus]|uniref:Uncharacterized protein n=1 Tax=Paramarasmius palmivorus TaxID=297713 RepID=A0AAW0AWM1_9AGAR
MTNSDPEEIASIRESARLDLYGEEERTWLKNRFPILSEDEEMLEKIQCGRVKFRGMLIKREASHARYVRYVWFNCLHEVISRISGTSNRLELQSKALENQKRRLNGLKANTAAWEDHKENRRMVQSRYYQRNRDKLNAKAREKRAIKKKTVTAMSSSVDSEKNPRTDVAGVEEVQASSQREGVLAKRQEWSKDDSELDDIDGHGKALDPPCEASLKALASNLLPGHSPANLETNGARQIAVRQRVESPDSLSTGVESTPTMNAEQAGPSSTGSTDEGDARSTVQNPLPFSHAGLEEGSSRSGSRKRRSGNPGNFEGEQLAMLEEAYPEYEKLPRRSKESGDWLRAMTVKFLEKFPVAKYPPPPAKQLDPVPDVDLNSLTPRRRKAHRKRVAAVEINDSAEGRQAQAVQRFFYWRASNLRGKEGESVVKFLNQMTKVEKRPRKQRVGNFLMSHPDYKDKVAEQSKETGRRDRLQSRQKAAKSVWNSMEDEERKDVTDGIQKKLEAALNSHGDNQEGTSGDNVRNSRTRRSVGRIMQPIIDTVHRLTGLSVVVLVGEDMNGNDLFDSATLSASPPGTPKITQFNTDKFRPFIEFFFRWLRFIRQDQLSKGLLKEATSPEPEINGDSTNTPSSSGTVQDLPPTGTPPPTKSVVNKGKGKEIAKLGDDSSAESSDDMSMRGGDDDAYGEDELSEEEPEAPVRRVCEPTQYPEGSYMAERAENIRRNKEMLASLGLDRNIFEMPSKSGTAKKGKSAKPNRPTNDAPRRSSRLSKASAPEGRNEINDKQDASSLEPVRSVTSQGRQRILGQCEKFIEDDPAVTTATLTDLVVELTTEGSDERSAWVAYVSQLSDVWFQRQENPLSEIQWPSPPKQDPQTAMVIDNATALPVPFEHSPPAAIHNVLPLPEEDYPPDEVHTPLQPTSFNAADELQPTSALAYSTTPTPGSSDPSEDLALPTPGSSAPSEDSVLQTAGVQEIRDDQEYVDTSSSRCKEVVSAHASIVVPVGYSYEPGEHDSATIQWFVDYLLAIPAKYSGPERPPIWDSVVFKWADLQELWEKVPGYPDKRAPKSTRPECIEQWNKGGRTRSRNWSAPVSAQLELLRADWWTWWASAFPETTYKHKGFVMPVKDADLAEMHLRGEHGIVLFLVVLRWWHDAGGHADPLGMWEEAIKSVYCVMDNMVREIVQSVSHIAENEPSPKRKRSSRDKGTRLAKRVRPSI